MRNKYNNNNTFGTKFRIEIKDFYKMNYREIKISKT